MKIELISKNQPHEQFEAICIACGYRFVANLPEGKFLRDMICPCGSEETIIRTGEHIHNLESLAEKYANEPLSQDEGL